MTKEEEQIIADLQAAIDSPLTPEHMRQEMRARIDIIRNPPPPKPIEKAPEPPTLSEDDKTNLRTRYESNYSTRE